ncbi:EF-hand domain-containing protein D2 [Polyplax serrata]|uniref:EF-hand domain-containing protein D2 n=1 Tax=Polyplax serrata TaxID=468196 RepID=A0AAN8SCZ7_POLSC
MFRAGVAFHSVKFYFWTFEGYDTGRDGYLDLEELKKMMEKIGAPQTHLGLKAMIKEVDEDDDGRISFREFLLIYRKAEAGELTEESGLSQLAKLTEINVDEVGVNGAKNFFEAKIEEVSRRNRFEEEIRAEQNERKRVEEEKAQRRLMFKERAAKFQCA